MNVASKQPNLRKSLVRKSLSFYFFPLISKYTQGAYGVLCFKLGHSTLCALIGVNCIVERVQALGLLPGGHVHDLGKSEVQSKCEDVG